MMEEKGKYHKHDHDVLRKDHASGVFGAELWVLFEPKRFIEGLCRLEGRDGQVDEDFRGEWHCGYGCKLSNPKTTDITAYQPT